MRGRQLRFVQYGFGVCAGRVPHPGVRRGQALPDAVLPAFLEAPLVVPVPVLVGHAGVVGFLAGLDFLEQVIRQLPAGRHHALEIGVLRLKVGQDVRVVHPRVTLVLQPVVGILDRDAVMAVGVGTAVRDRRLGGCLVIGHLRVLGSASGKRGGRQQNMQESRAC